MSRCRYHFVVPASEGPQSLSDAASLPGLVEASYAALHPERAQLQLGSGPAPAAAQLPAALAPDNAAGSGEQSPAVMLGGHSAGDDPAKLTAAGEAAGESALSAAISAAVNGVSSQLPASALAPGGVDDGAAPSQLAVVAEPPAADPPTAAPTAELGAPHMLEDGTAAGDAVPDSTRASMEASDRASPMPAHPTSIDAAFDGLQQPQAAEPAEQGGTVNMNSDGGQRAADVVAPADVPHKMPVLAAVPGGSGSLGAVEASEAAGIDAIADASGKDAVAAADERRAADDAEAAVKAAAPEAEGPSTGAGADTPDTVTGLPGLPAGQGTEPGPSSTDTQVMCC